MSAVLPLTNSVGSLARSMMKLLSFLRNSALVLMASAVVLSASLFGATEPRVSAYIVESSGAVTDGIAEGTFKVSVTNGEASDATNLVVVFSEDSSLSVGDIAAGATVVSGPVTITMDVSTMATKNTPMPVTLKFTLDGAAVEMPYNLTLARQ